MNRQLETIISLLLISYFGCQQKIINSQDCLPPDYWYVDLFVTDSVVGFSYPRANVWQANPYNNETQNRNNAVLTDMQSHANLKIKNTFQNVLKLCFIFPGWENPDTILIPVNKCDSVYDHTYYLPDWHTKNIKPVKMDTVKIERYVIPHPSQKIPKKND